MDVCTFAELLTPEGQELLADVAAHAGIESDLALGTRLRKSHEPGLVAAAVTQHHLRGKAAVKFGPDSARMYFTHDALEQSTRSAVARHRAARLADSGCSRVVDLGCGIGGDLIAFARAGMTVRGIEIDPVRAAITRANLDALGLDGEIECGDATAIRIGDGETAFIDPARRNARGRTIDPKGFEPSWEFASSALAGHAVVKTMPGIAHHVVPAGVEAEWVSDSGDLVEACLWGRPYASAKRRATVLPSGATLTQDDDPGGIESGGIESGDVGAVIYEPDDAVIRAGLVTAVAAQVGGRLLDEHIAYVISDRLMPTPFARAFRVLAELPFREKPLRAALMRHAIGTLTVKKRGVNVVPETMIRRLRLGGAHTGTIIMTRVQGVARAYLVEPVWTNPQTGSSTNTTQL